jgi:hypothetical protein
MLHSFMFLSIEVLRRVGWVLRVPWISAAPN